MLGFLGLVLATVILAVYILKGYMARPLETWKSQGVRVLKSKKRTFLSILRNGVNSLLVEDEYYEILGDEGYGGLAEFGKATLFIKDLELIKHVMIKDFEYFTDRRNFADSDPLFVNSVLFMKGGSWKSMRNFLTPTFTSGKIRRMFEQFDKSSEKLAQYVEKECPKSGFGFDVKVDEIVKRYTVDVIGSVAFGIDTGALTEKNSEFLKYALKASDFSGLRIFRTILMNVAPRIASFFDMRVFDKDINDFFSGIVKSAVRVRESSGEKRNDFLQLLLEAKAGELKGDDGELEETVSSDKNYKVELTDDVLLAQAFIFFLAGFDTVSGLLQNVLYMFAVHPEVQEKARQDVDLRIQATNGKVTYESVNSMDYLDMVMSETLRLYSLVSTRLERRCVKDYKLPGTNVIVPKDSLVVAPVTAIHMDEKFYPDPKKFDPERFSSENKAKRSQYAFMPFGHGPRNCIGMRFALVESKAVLAHILMNFVIEAGDKTPIPVKMETKVGVTRATKDLEVRMVPRK